MTSARSRPHRAPPEDLAPTDIVRQINTMWWPELDALANRLLSRMGLVAEAPGTRINPDRVHSGKPGSQAPRSSAFHGGSHSLRDHWEARFAKAATRDLDTDSQEPVQLRQAVLRASIELHQIQHRPAAPAFDPDASDAGVERDDWICSDAYLDLDPHVVATFETLRAGWVTAEAVRRTRRRNGLHSQSGRPLPTDGTLRSQILAFHYEGLSIRRIAMEVGVGKSTVDRVLADGQRPSDVAG